MHRMTRALLPALMMGVMCYAFSDTPVESRAAATTTSPSAPTALTPAQSCASACDAAETQCSSEVRRARAECSKRAATGGRDPFTGRNTDYAYFCGYFNNGNACGNGPYSNSCRSRFAHTYGVCTDYIQNNIAAMRYDCYQTEKSAQTYCRDELRACKAQCPAE